MQCIVCGVEYATRDDLARHLRTKHLIRPCEGEVEAE